jgi:protein O-GlcNAc transferase
MPSIPQIFAMATQHHQAGRLGEAEPLYRQILSNAPNHADTLNMLGVLMHQKGNQAAAIELLGRSVQLDRNSGVSHFNYALALQAAGRLDDAIEQYRCATRLQDYLADAHYALAFALQRKGLLAEAITEFRRTLALRLGDADAQIRLATSLRDTGQFEQAIEEFIKAIALRPQDAGLYNDLGNALQEKGRLTEAAAAYQQTLALQPDHAVALNNLGVMYNRKGLLDEAVAAFNRATSLKPDFAAAYTNLGNAQRDRGDLDGAIVSLRKALDLNVNARESGNLLYTLHLHPHYGPQDIFEEAKRWNDKYARPLKPAHLGYPNNPDPNRPLRIGYVSSDFRTHPVGRFLLPLLAHHDRQRFEIFCYAEVRKPDAITERSRSYANIWRDTLGMSDETLAEQIRADQIDILVDLAMQLENSRLMTFARKPAPVQVTYLAYCSTTGLETMDYRLTDPYFDPIEQDDRCYSEKSVRLPHTYWCHEPLADVPEVMPPPLLSAGYVTFGCLNAYAKVTRPTWDAWCALLAGVANSRLIVHSPEGTHRQQVWDLLATRGIDPQRLTFVAKTSPRKYFEQYQQIDIALDPFPFAGGTTTCDALWMGVPVVTLVGSTAVSRGGLSILSNVGLTELVARSTDQYVKIASDLAHNPQRVTELRSSMRERMRNSQLMDAPAFARDVENAFRAMWRNWCDTR